MTTVGHCSANLTLPEFSHGLQKIDSSPLANCDPQLAQALDAFRRTAVFSMANSCDSAVVQYPGQA